MGYSEHPAEDDGSDRHAGQIMGLYRRHAIAWIRARGTKLVEAEWLDRFCSVLPPSGDELLDLGCGSGMPIACELVQRGYRVIGIDSSPEMIGLSRQNLPGQSAVVADMRGLDLEHRFAGLLAWDSFFHLPRCDQRSMFAVFRAHAAPGAGLMFTSGTHDGVAIGSLEGEPLYHASLAPAEYRHLLAKHGLRLIRHVADDPLCQGRTVWLARLDDTDTPT